jgi:hypothetical protein
MQKKSVKEPFFRKLIKIDDNSDHNIDPWGVMITIFPIVDYMQLVITYIKYNFKKSIK